VPSSPIIHPQSQKLLVPYDRVCALWPDAQTINYRNEKYSIFPHHPYSQIQLRAVNLDVPPPILYYFDWASADGIKPFEVQKQTAALATSYQRAYILNDLGTGKTRAALWSWFYLRQAGVAKKLLVVAPLSTLKFVWLRRRSRPLSCTVARSSVWRHSTAMLTFTLSTTTASRPWCWSCRGAPTSTP
jgi:hypothetical protein